MVDIWLFPTNFAESDCTGFVSMLSPEESAKAARFHFEVDRVRSIVARATLRRLLAETAGCYAADLRFAANSHGKPSAELPLSFNVSHSGDFAAIGISRSAEVGVDIEHMRENVEIVSIAQHYFCPSEVEWLTGLPTADQPSGFYRLWTLKEAVLKAHGAGLSVPLNEVCVWPAGTVTVADGEQWSASPWDAPKGYAAAVAIDGPAPPSFRIHHLHRARQNGQSIHLVSEE